MDLDKKRSKGGFLNLFDWPGKSRKKLFSNSSEPPDDTNKERSEDANFSKSQPHHIDRDETRTNSSNNARSDFSCRSSVASDEEHGTRAPSVVARLMGLDSLPVPSVPDSRVNPILDAYILESSRRYEHSDYICFPNDLECVPWNHVESRTSRPQNRTIERFKTEMLPPKSAKPIPISHNRLLSPIRGPGFRPIRNPAYIMEAASRMIETSPRVLTKSRVSTVGSSSVPMRIRDLKEKLEAAHKSSTVGTIKYPREGQAEKRLTSSSQCTTTSTLSGKGISARPNIGGKSAPPAAQAKTKIQKKECSVSSYSRVTNFHKEKTEPKNRVLKNHSDVQRSIHRATSANSPKTVLRQNNQKQNCKDSSSSNTPVPNQKGKKVANKVVNKVVVESESGSSSGSRKMGSSATSSGKDVSSSRKRIVTRNKKSPDGYPEKRICDDTIRRERSIKCNVTVDEDTSSNQKKGVDVISFTFSSPIKGHGWDPQSSSSRGRVRETNSSVGSAGVNSTHTTGYNIIPGDSLSVLLEQKLRELNYKFESYGCGVNQEESPVSTCKAPSPSLNSVYESGCISGDDQGHDGNQKIQVIQLDEAKETGTDGISTGAWKEFDHVQPSPTTSFGSSAIGSCTDSRDTINGITQFVQDPKKFNWVFPNEPYPAEEDNREVSESASMAAFSCIESEEPDNWELQYINSILNNSQLKLEPFVLGKTQDVIPLGLFEQLEDHGDSAVEKVERKALFDCVIKCLRCRQEKYLTGRFEEWTKDAVLFERKDWLAEELHKEILGWKDMGDLMVDELVDKDMSSLSGKWIDYKNEEFEEGVEIVKVIVSGLVDDLISDLLVF